MTIKYAILGFLSWSPLTGYDLKKLFADSETLYWSGNNNQIYKTLVELHQENLVTKEVQHQENLPSRKVYTITDKGLAELKQWLLSPPELPQLKNPFLIRLAWADQLTSDELDALLESYEKELAIHLLMLREQAQRNSDSPKRTQREIYLWNMMSENWITFYENELNWVRRLRKELGEAND